MAAHPQPAPPLVPIIQGGALAVALGENSVWLYALDDQELQKDLLLKRFKAPALCVAFNDTGSVVAAGAE